MPLLLRKVSRHRSLVFKLLIPVVVYLSLATLYLFAIPSGESPDEPGHFVCLEQVALYNRLPIIEPKPEGEFWWSRGRIVAGHMCYHTPLYYVVAGMLLKGVAVGTDTAVHFEFPPSNPNGPNPNMFVHENKPSFWQIPEPPTIITLRLFSISLGLLIVVLTFFITTRYFPDNNVGSLAALLIAGWPQFIFLSRGISNDILALALAIIVLALLLMVHKPRRFILAALVTSLAVLTKLTTLFSIVALLIVWGLEFWHTTVNKRSYLRILLLCALIWMGSGLFILLNPTISQQISRSNTSFVTINEKAWTFSYWIDVFLLTLSSGWVRFGWMNVPAPNWHAYLWWAVIAISVLMGIYVFWRSNMQNRRLLLTIAFVWVVGVLLTYVRINSNRFQPQFRFALASLPLICAFTAGGMMRVVGKRPYAQPITLFSVTLFLIIYNSWFLFTTVSSTYGWEF